LTGSSSTATAEITANQQPVCATTNGMAWEPGSNLLWTVAQERDGNLALDYLASVHDGGFYGWP